MREDVSGEGRITARDEEQRPQVSDIGKRAASGGRYQGSSGRSKEDEDLTDLSNQTDAPVEKGLDSTAEELSESQPDHIDSLNLSDTDEDEDEGLGDGKIGRTVREK